jgi:hypothetical protein
MAWSRILRDLRKKGKGYTVTNFVLEKFGEVRKADP